jgi:hypothetical protein
MNNNDTLMEKVEVPKDLRQIVWLSRAAFPLHFSRPFISIYLGTSTLRLINGRPLFQTRH